MDYSDIEKLWKTTGNEDIHVYIHSPFCRCRCRYCLYSGKEDPSRTEVIYFIKTLKQSLFRFSSLLSARKIRTLYFGGGTPNFYDNEDFKNIFDTAYSVCKPENTIAELNPAYVNAEWLDSFCKTGKVNLITFGIQSFDRETLAAHNRPYVSVESLQELIDICHNSGVIVSIDLMCYLKTYSSTDINLLDDDIAKAINTKVDFITVYPEQNLIKKDRQTANEFSAYIKGKLDTGYGDYYIDIAKYDKENGYSQEYNPSLVYRIISNKYDYQAFRDKILTYYENDFAAAEHNIMGFGDKNCSQDVVSYSPGRFCYVEKYSYPDPVYEIKYNATETKTNEE